MDEFVTPPPLSRGDRIAIVSPAAGAAADAAHVYELGLERLEGRFDLEPVEFPTARKPDGWLYDHPEARARDIEDAFRDPEVGGVLATIGGNDQIRVLRHLDTEVLAENPTRFFGWSDNTNVALALWNEGIVSYYGPSVMVELAMDGSMFDHTVEYAERAFFDDSFGELAPADAFTDEPTDWTDPDALAEPRATEASDGWRWENGDDAVSGRLWGGCWEIVVQQLLCGDYLPDPERLDGAILAIETSEEVPEPSSVAGNLRAMGERGFLQRFDGVLVGRPAAQNHVEPRPREWRVDYRERLRETVVETLAEYNPDAPVVLDVEFGHTYPRVPVPIGSEVTVDPGAERIAFE